MEDYLYFDTTVYTAEHRQVKGLPMHALNIFVELTADKKDQAASLIPKIADKFLHQFFNIDPLHQRATETRFTLIQSYFGARPMDSDYRDENGAAKFLKDLSDKHPQLKKPVKPSSEEDS